MPPGPLHDLCHTGEQTLHHSAYHVAHSHRRTAGEERRPGNMVTGRIWRAGDVPHAGRERYRGVENMLGV